MRLNKLSKTELISLIQNYIDINDNEDVQCVVCGNNDSEFCYVCDKCSNDEEIILDILNNIV